MSDQTIEGLLDQICEWDRDFAETVELALAYGESGEPVLEKMLKRRLEDMVGEDECCDICVGAIEMPQLPEDDPGFDDDFADSYDPDSEPEEPQVDELSQKLGVDVDNQTPLGLAVAILKTAGTDEVLQEQLIQELGRRGKNVAQLSTLVEGL